MTLNKQPANNENLGVMPTQNLESEPDRKSVCSSPQRLSLDVTDKDDQISELQRQIQALEQSAKSESQRWQKKLSDQESELSEANDRREEIQRQLQESITKSNRLERQLEVHLMEQAKGEQRAVGLCAEAKQKWKKKAEAFRIALKAKTDFVKEFEDDFYECRTNELTLLQKLEQEKEESTKVELLVAENRKLKGVLKKGKKESVDGYQLKLLDEVIETKDFEIAELNQRMSDVEEQNNKMERSLKDKETELSKLREENALLTKTIKELECKLEKTTNEIDDAKRKDVVIQDRRKDEKLKVMMVNVSTLQDWITKFFQTHEKEVRSQYTERGDMFEQMQDMQQSIRETANEKLKVECELRKMENKVQLNEQRIQDLLKKIEQLQDLVDSAEKSKSSNIGYQKSCCDVSVSPDTCEEYLQQQKPHVKERVLKLETLLKSSNKLAENERQKCIQAQDELFKLQKQLTDARLDASIARQNAKMFEGEIGAYGNRLIECERQIKEKNKESMVAKEKEKILCLQINDLKKQISSEKTQKEAEECLITELGEVRDRYEEVSKQKLQLENENKTLRDDNDSFCDHLSKIQNRLEEQTKHSERLEKNFSALKDATVVIEEQLTEYENIVENQDATEVRLNNEFEVLVAKKRRVENQLTQAQVSLDRETIQRKTLESKLKEMEAHIAALKVSHASVAKTLRSKLQDREQAVAEYNNLLVETERRLCEAEVARKNLQSRHAALEHETIRIKEEAAQLITNNCKLSDENSTLTMSLRDIRVKCDDTYAKLEKCNQKMREDHDYEVVILRSQISQQMKLIEFMQRSMTKKKKKTFQERIFGRNIHNLPETSSSSKASRETPLNSIDLVVGESQENQRVSEFDRSSSSVTKERKVPHRFQLVANPRAVECSACLETLRFGRKVAKCTECNMTVHPKCASALPTACESPRGPTWRLGRKESRMTIDDVGFEQLSKASENASGFLGEVVLHLEDDDVADVKCAVHYDSETLLLGTEEGLLVCKLNGPEFPRVVKGVDYVFQMAVVPKLNCLIIISEKQQILNQVDLLALASVLDSPSNDLPFTAVQPIDGVLFCHLFSFAHTLGEYFVCAAVTNAVLILKWDRGNQKFVVQKEVRTLSEPCCCILFRTRSVLFGTDKFFEIDLQKSRVKEFLDTSDSSVAFDVLQIPSCPVAVLLVSEPSAPEEFLLCFNDFGLFANVSGHRTRRGNMKWTRLPLAFVYRAPYLLITHFDSVEVVLILEDEDIKSKHIFLEFREPRYLGSLFEDEGIYLASVRKDHVIVFRLRRSRLSAIDWTSQDDVSTFSDGFRLEDEGSTCST